MRFKHMLIKKWELLFLWGGNLFRHYYCENGGRGKSGQKV